MSAMPDNVLPFELPAKPRIRQQEPLPDQRKIVVLPFKAVFDKRLGNAGVAVLAGITAYCNRAGITWVSQRRLAGDLNCTQQAVSKQVAKLKELGYIEVLRKGYSGARHETIRVIFDPTITGHEAIAMVSNKEDARPPGMIKEEEDRLQQEIDLEGIKRIKEMMKVTQKETTMKRKNKSPISVDNSVDKPVDNLIQRQPEVVELHNSGLSLNTVFNIKKIHLIINEKKIQNVLENEIELKIDLLMKAYQREGVEPTEQALIDGVIDMLVADRQSNAI